MHYFTSIILMALEIIPCSFIILTIFRNNIKKPKRQSAVIVGISLILLALISILCSYLFQVVSFAPMIAAVASAIFVSIILYQLTDLMFTQCLYSILLLSNLTDCAKLIARTTYKDSPMPNPPDLVLLGKMAVVLAFVFTIAYFLFKKFFRPLLIVTCNMKIWNYLCLIPCVLFFVYRFNIYPDYFHQAFHWHPGYYLLPGFWIFVVVLVHYSAMQAPIFLIEKLVLEDKLHYSELLTDAQLRQYESIKDSIQTERRMRHDFRHTLLAIQTYALQNDTGSILKYIDSYLVPLNQPLTISYCKNTFMNAFLGHFLQRADKEHIKTTYTISLPEEIELPEPDLCVLFGNLLENALEACQRQTTGQRFMTINIEMTSKRILSLSISNSYTGVIRQKGSSYLSSKRNDLGIGLASVEHIVENYNGMMKVSHSDGVFTVSVLINITK